MKEVLKRWIPRSIHFVFSIPIIGYIYSPVAQAQLYADRVRFFFLPAMVVSGLWMWKGHAVRRLIARTVGRSPELKASHDSLRTYRPADR